MTHSEKPATRATRAGLSVVHLSGEDKEQRSGSRTETQGTGSCPLFNPKTRDAALHTANELNAAAVRHRQSALTNPDAGAVLHRVAALYAQQAADWFRRADTLPSIMGAAH